MQLTQIAKVVQCIAPIDGNGGIVQAARVNMAKYEHVTFICGIGNLAADIILTMYSAATSLAAGTVMNFNYRRSTTPGALVSVVDTTPMVNTAALTISNATEDNDCIVIEVDAADLPAPLTRQYVGVDFSNAGAASLISVVAICMWPRYAAEPNLMPDPTAA